MIENGYKVEEQPPIPAPEPALEAPCVAEQRTYHYNYEQ